MHIARKSKMRFQLVAEKEVGKIRIDKCKCCYISVVMRGYRLPRISETSGMHGVEDVKNQES